MAAPGLGGGGGRGAGRGGAVNPTVDQIETVRLARIANEYWAPFSACAKKNPTNRVSSTTFISAKSMGRSSTSEGSNATRIQVSPRVRMKERIDFARAS